MIMELLGHEDYLRILLAVRKRGSMRFGEIEKWLALNPAQVDRALKFLRKGLWIIPRTIRTEKGPVLVEYKLGKRGATLLELFDSFRMEAQQRRADLGSSEIEELAALDPVEHEELLA